MIKMKRLIFQLWLFWERLSLKRFGKSILSIFGAIWLIIEILAFFGQQTWSDNIRSIWWIITIAGLALIIYKNWPRTLYSYKVQNRDVSISIKIGDIFRVKGALIVPINNRLDCDNNGIVRISNSILKCFIQNIYNKTAAHLDTDITQQIEDNSDWYDKFLIDKESNEYKIGTVVPIFRDEKQYYLLCSSTLNERGRSRTTVDDLRTSLNELWAYLTHSGSKDNLAIPIVGTGRGRIPLKRDEVIKEIVLSFLVSLSQESYCDQLTIVIHPNDLKKFKIDLNELLDFIRLQCNNTGYLKGNETPTGTGLE
jgi:Thoeris protein ThsA, Macro domain